MTNVRIHTWEEFKALAIKHWLNQNMEGWDQTDRTKKNPTILLPKVWISIQPNKLKCIKKF
jgi:hypothetical protein